MYTYSYHLNSNGLTSLGQNFYNPLLLTFDATADTYTTDNQIQTSADQNGTTTYNYYADGMLGYLSYQAVNSGSGASTIGYTYDLTDRLIGCWGQITDPSIVWGLRGVVVATEPC